MIAENSLRVFNTLVRPKLTERELDVLRFVQDFPNSTCAEIAVKMRKFPNQISGRFAPLEEKGYIEAVEDRPCSVTGNTATAWKEKRSDYQPTLF